MLKEGSAMKSIYHNVAFAISTFVGVFAEPSLLKHEFVLTMCGMIAWNAASDTYREWKQFRRRRKRRLGTLATALA
jgi:hypothetical protein